MDLYLSDLLLPKGTINYLIINHKSGSILLKTGNPEPPPFKVEGTKRNLKGIRKGFLRIVSKKPPGTPNPRIG